MATPPSGTALDKQFDVNLTNFPPFRRHKVVVNVGGYTTGDGENHLLSYGEYAAMYLAAWSPRVWSALGAPDTVYRELASSPAELRPFFDEPEKKKPYNGVLSALIARAKESDSGFADQVVLKVGARPAAVARSTVPVTAATAATSGVADVGACPDADVAGTSRPADARTPIMPTTDKRKPRMTQRPLARSAPRRFMQYMRRPGQSI